MTTVVTVMLMPFCLMLQPSSTAVRALSVLISSTSILFSTLIKRTTSVSYILSSYHPLHIKQTFIDNRESFAWSYFCLLSTFLWVVFTIEIHYIVWNVKLPFYKIFSVLSSAVLPSDLFFFLFSLFLSKLELHVSGCKNKQSNQHRLQIPTYVEILLV